MKSRALPLAVIGAVACGVGIAVQSRINGELGAQLHDGFMAAVLSFAIGLGILAVLLLVMRSGRAGVRTVVTQIRDGRIPWWYAMGGASGGFFVLTQGLASAALGVALFSIGIVCGQTVSGVVIDRIGLGTHDPRPLSVQRLLGAALALAAVAIAASSQFGSGTSGWLFALPFIAGLFISWQQAVNGQIRRVSGSVLTATFGNFLVGTVLLVVATLVHSMVVGWPAAYPTNPVLYLGGATGVVFIGLGAAVVGTTGVLLLTLGTITGQLITSLVLDLVAPVAGDVVDWTTYAGIALALAAVVIVALAPSSRLAAAPATDADRGAISPR